MPACSLVFARTVRFRGSRRQPQQLRQLQADAVIAVGGGSAIVTARAASILLAENDAPRSLCTTRDERGGLRSPRLLAPKLRQFVAPTTPTTASVKAGSAIFNPVAGERLALFDPKTRAQAVFIHPDLILSAPRQLMTSAALDTLSLAIEGLTSRSIDPLADAQLMHAVRLLAEHLPKLASSGDLEARAALMHAAVLCGLGSDHTGAGMAILLGHAIGARHEADNGVVKAIVLPHVLRVQCRSGGGWVRQDRCVARFATVGGRVVRDGGHHRIGRFVAGNWHAPAPEGRRRDQRGIAGNCPTWDGLLVPEGQPSAGKGRRGPVARARAGMVKERTRLGERLRLAGPPRSHG